MGPANTRPSARTWSSLTSHCLCQQTWLTYKHSTKREETQLPKGGSDLVSTKGTGWVGNKCVSNTFSLKKEEHSGIGHTRDKSQGRCVK